jgi:basic amino acid/polyamine antiporter, APA family
VIPNSPTDAIRGPTELNRQLGLGTAAALVVGEVIGVGIFLTPAEMAKSLSSPFWLLVVWLVMGASSLAGALCFGSLAACFPESGGGYAYLRRAFGRRMGFLYGWLSLFVTDPGITAALTVGMAKYANSLIPLSAVGQQAVAIAAIVALATANIIGLRFGAGLLRTLTIIKVVLLAILVIWGFGFGRGEWSNFVPLVARRDSSEPLLLALAGSLVAAFFTFGGWWDLSKIAGEVRDPERTVPRAMVLGVIATTVIFVLISSVFLYLVPLSRISTNEGFATQVGQALFGRAGGQTFAALVVVCLLSTLAANLMAMPRVYFAMSRDGLFLPAVAAIHPKFGTPARAITLQAGMASILVATGKFDQILAFFVFPTVIFLVLIVATVYVKGPNSSAPVRSRIPGYPITPLLFLLPTSGVLVLLALKDPYRAFLGFGIVLLGIPVYQLAFARTVPGEIAGSISPQELS